jgi:hypothetical protein
MNRDRLHGRLCFAALLGLGFPCGVVACSEHVSGSATSAPGAGPPASTPNPVDSTEGDADPAGAPATIEGIAPGAVPADGGPATNPTAGPGVPSPTSTDIEAPPAEPALDGAAPLSRARRISRGDFDRVLSDLLRMDVSVAGGFPEEIATLNGYFDDGTLVVNDRLRTELALTAEQLSQRLRDDDVAFGAVVGCERTEPSCRDTFIDGFLSRAYRRPIESEERARYAALFDSAAESIGTGDAFADGVQLVVEAALQSPKFLYRIEQGGGASDEQGLLLTDHEIASRLSFLILGTMPDDELFAAADAGGLHSTEQIAEQAERLLQDPRVAGRVRDFHDRFLQLEGLASASKDPALFAPFDHELVASMREEAARFTEEVTLVEGAGIRRLLTAPYGFVDDRLAGVYDLGGSFGAELARIDYEADSPRAGILTQAAFLSGHSSSSTTTSPILRGRFVLERILCFEVPEPPANAASQEPPPPTTPPVTTRDMFAWKTSMDTCMTCHSLLNPPGFAFEAFDAIGRHRTEEGGAPVDPSGTSLYPMSFSFTDAADFVTQIAELPEARTCYAKNWLRFAYARAESDQDQQTLETLATGLTSDAFGARDVLLTLTQSAAFSHLPLEAE